MQRKKQSFVPTERDCQIYMNVLGNFKKNKTSLEAWCAEKGINSSNAAKAIKRQLRGKTPTALRREIIRASKIKPTTQPTQDNSHAR